MVSGTSRISVLNLNVAQHDVEHNVKLLVQGLVEAADRKLNVT